MPPLRPSVIIVSRGRPTLLARAVMSLSQQDHPQFEVIVVADPAGLAVVAGWPIKRVAFDQANISVARNLGLAQAAGDIVAFMDDDAVAEPTWLSRLTAPFADAGVVAATGFVRGRNGISFQWRAARVDASGRDHPFDVGATTVFDNQPHLAVKTQGTNCAFRTTALRAIGGFDPAYRFYLDEADVNLRLARHGMTAIVPNAQVHHAYAAGPLRRANRVPRSLFDIGASSAVFLRRHGGSPDRWAEILAEQGLRLSRLRRRLLITNRTANALMNSLRQGWEQGLEHPLADLPPQDARGAAPFLPLPGTGHRPGVVLSGWCWQAHRLRAEAVGHVAAGKIVTIFLFSPTRRAHWHRYHSAGFWVQTGGLFGRSLRQGPNFLAQSRAARTKSEVARISSLREVGSHVS